MSEWLDYAWRFPVNAFSLLVALAVLVLAVGYAVARPKFFLLMLKNLLRNPVRTSLISLATVVLVAQITLIWAVLYFLDRETEEKAKNLKLIVTEKYQLPSQMPMTHADYLDPSNPKFLKELKGLYGPNDFMTWSSYGGSTVQDPKLRTFKDIVFFFAMPPDQIIPMMEDLEMLDPALVQKLKSKRDACLVGTDRLANLKLEVGGRFKVTSMNYKDIDLDFEIVGTLPEGRHNPSAIMNADYFLDAFYTYENKTKKKHPSLDKNDRRLNLIWLRVPDRDTFTKVGNIIESSPVFSQPYVKVETASSGISSFLEAYKSILSGAKYILVPAILAIMALVVAVAIFISVSERRSEIAVLKVLGFKPSQVTAIVLGEALLLGVLSGLLAASLTVFIINFGFGGLKLPIAFFGVFYISPWALAWGPAMGAVTAILGSAYAAYQAGAVKVTEVFSKVA